MIGGAFMKCKYCGYSAIPDGSLYCNMCGKSVRRVRKKGKTEVKVPDPKPLVDGFYIRFMVNGTSHYVSAPTAEECIAKAIAIKTGVLKAPKRTGMTLGELIDKYLENVKNISPSTMQLYKSIRRSRLKRYLGTKVDSINNWQKVLDEETETGLSYSGVKNVWKLVSNALKYEGYPIPEVSFPQEIKREKAYLTPDEIKKFVSLVKDTPYCIGALLALHSLRRSEIMDVTWEDIDLVEDTIYVRGSAVMGPDGKIIHKETNKTKESRRKIPIMIPELKDAFIAADKSNEYVVPMNSWTLYNGINKICNDNNLPLVGIHGLRHSFASLAYHLNVPMEITCRMGGWNGTQTVLEIYTHLYEEDIMKNQNAMSNFYRSEPQDSKG